jgi:D-arabinose 5-phosphate isomerase GutQ
MSTNKNSITFSTVGDGDVISVSANKKSSLAQYADVNYIVKQTLEDRSSTTVRPKLRDYKSVFGNSNE